MADRAYFYLVNQTEKGTLTVTSETVGYPLGNLTDRDRHSYWKNSNTTNPQVFTLDAAAAVPARSVLLVHDNLYAKSIGLRVYVDLNDNPAFPDKVYLVGTAGAAHASTASDVPLWFERFAAEYTKRYWRAELYGVTTADLLVADFQLYPEIDIGRHPGGPWDLGYRDSTKLTDADAQTFATSTRPPLREMGLTFSGVDKTTVVDAIEAGYLVVRAGFLPFLYRDEYGTLRLVRFADKPRWNHQFGTLWNGTVTLVEDA